MNSLSKILIVDDDPAVSVLLQQMLMRNGYENMRTTNRPDEMMNLLESFDPDVVLLDLHMPETDGYEILSKLPRDRKPRLLVLAMTADTDVEAKRKALVAGAQDFVHKPFDEVEVMLRVENLLTTRRMETEAEEQRKMLEQRIVDRTRENIEAHIATIYRLAMAAEFRDDDLGEHIFRVGRSTGLLAEAIGQDPTVARLYKVAATLHDVGKIAVPDAVLLKPGKLDEDDWVIMRTHAEQGSKVLDGNDSQIMNSAARIALAHHEKWDGSGYPHGLSGPDIATSARLVAVADVFDALTSERPYKDPWPIEDAAALIKEESGKHFDPDMADAFSGLDLEFLTSSVDRKEFFQILKPVSDRLDL